MDIISFAICFWNSIGYVGGGKGGNYYIFLENRCDLAIYEAGSLGYLYTGLKAHL